MDNSQLQLYNTLSRKKEHFSPEDESKVKMYVCGPTIYDHPHIGNIRSCVIYDLLFRTLRYKYGSDKVLYVRNITDVDDKINIRAKELKITIQELTKQTLIYFHESVDYLNCLRPNIEPKATNHIAEMIRLIEILIEKKHAYIAAGNVYFAVNSFKDYNILSNRNFEEMLTSVRIENETDKENMADFALWKKAAPEDDPSAIFDSPWGSGKPGWHIECSAMSMKFLGITFDIHGGGADLIFPHHTNEIAQSICATEGEYARFWVHNGFLTVRGEKMSKSLGNFITVKDLQNQDISGDIIRYMLLSTHYRKPLDYNNNLLHMSRENINQFLKLKQEFSESQNLVDVYVPKELIEFLYDDLNSHMALTFLSNLARQISKLEDYEDRLEKYKIFLKSAEFLGFKLEIKKVKNKELIEELIEERKTAKLNKSWAKADEIRLRLESMGVIIEDLKDGSTKWYLS